MPSSAWSSDVCSSDRSEEHTSELQSQSNLVCRIISSEKHTSELQSQSNRVCRLLLEKKNPDGRGAPPAHACRHGVLLWSEPARCGSVAAPTGRSDDAT